MSTNTVWRARVIVRSAIAVISAAVVALTAFAWTQVQLLDRSTTQASVISGSTGSGTATPAAEQNILLLGVDSRSDPRGNPLPPVLLDALHAGDGGDGGDTADTLIVVHVPAGGGRATAFSIPRDSYVQLADGFGKHKINSAYARAANATTNALTGRGGSAGSPTSPFSPDVSRASNPDDPAVRRAALAAGARTTIGTVQALTGLPITHFASVNLAGFADVSDAIGGVPVCLREAVDDPYSGLRLPAGPQQVSGTQALAFVRQRQGLPNGDLDRIARQQVFLASATRELLSAGTLVNPFAVDRLSDVMTRSVTLDDSWDVLGFAQQMQGLSAGAVTFRTIPTGTIVLPTPSDGLAVQVEPTQVRRFVDDAMAIDAGRPQAPPPAAALAPAARATSTAPSDDDTTTSPSTPAPVPPPITAAAPGCIN